MKDNEKNDKIFRNTIGFGKMIKKNSNKENKSNKTNAGRSLSLHNNKLLQKYKPTLKPIGAGFDPSPINLFAKEEINIDDIFEIEPKEIPNKKLYKLKTEDINKNEINSKNEIYNHRLSYKITDINDNGPKDSDNKLNNIDNNNISKIKKDVNYCINKVRRSMDKIKNKIKIKKFKDDSNVYNFSCRKYFDENYRLRTAQKFIDKLKMEKMKEYEKYKNKTISFKDINSYKGPILGFLQMNELSGNLTLSSINLSEI